MTTKIAEYSATEAGIAELHSRLAGVVYDVTKPTQMIAARKDRRECVRLRSDLETLRTTLKADVLERGRLIDGEARRIREAIESVEKPIDEQIKAEETRVERERQEAERNEAERIQRIQDAIAALNAMPTALIRCTSAECATSLADLRKYVVGAWAFEFQESVQAAKDSAIAAVEKLYNAALEREAAAAAEAKQREEERAELARLRKEQEERDRQAAALRAEDERKAAAARAEIEAAARASREKIEREERAARMAREEEDRKAAAARAAERQRQDEEAAALKAERDRVEAERRETERLQNELLDGAAMLEKFVQRFGKRREFAAVVKAIAAYLERIAA